jgi:uncharacterized protein YjbI with pentapeptide repeats
LYEAQLQGADLGRAQLQGANLCWVNLQGVNLQGANLQGANLYQAQLQGAYLGRAQLQGVYIGLFYDKLTFEKRISQQADKETENKKLIDQYEPLNNEEKQALQALIDQFEENNPLRMTGIINRIQQADDILDLSNTETGKYSKQQAQMWIDEFNQSK